MPDFMSARASVIGLTVTLAFAVNGVAFAQAYPAKSVRMVVPFAPGGGTDVIARHLASRMSDSLKRQIVVDNRAGANGIVGTENVAHAPADGYTLLFVSSPHSVNPSLYAKLPYDTLRDFAPVSMAATWVAQDLKMCLPTCLVAVDSIADHNAVPT